MSTEDFYLRYYVGHKGKFGHEFLEFEFRPDGKLRYANNSNYKNDTMIRKEAFVHQSVMEELKRIIIDSEIMQEDDLPWPPPDRVGRQVHIRIINNKCISNVTLNITHVFTCRNWRLSSAMSTSRLLPQKRGLWWTSTVPKIQRACAVSITWCRISSVWSFR